MIPMLVHLVLQAKLTGMGRPSRKTPAAFNLIGMCVAIVKMLPHALPIERPATAMVHFGRWPKLQLLCQKRPKYEIKGVY